MPQISFAIVARKYAAARGFLPKTQATMRVIAPLTLERSLLLAVALLVAGVAGVLHCVGIWRSAGFGVLQYGGLVPILSVSATTIDDLLILAILFADQKLQPRHIVIGQFLGFAVLIAGSLIAATAAFIAVLTSSGWRTRRG